VPRIVRCSAAAYSLLLSSGVPADQATIEDIVRARGWQPNRRVVAADSGFSLPGIPRFPGLALDVSWSQGSDVGIIHSLEPFCAHQRRGRFEFSLAHELAFGTTRSCV